MQTAASGAPSTPPHRIRYDLTGCHITAILLERIQFWMPRTRVRRSDGAWIAKSRADLMRETGLTEKQLRTSIDKLKARDIIETSRHDFGGETILHLRFTPRGTITMRDAGLLKMERVALEGQTGVALEGETGVALEGNSLTQADIDKRVYTSGYIPSETPNGVPEIAKPVSEQEITGKEPDMDQSIPKKGLKAPTPLPPAPKARVSAADVLAKLSAKGKGVPTPKKGKKLPLGAVWKDALAKTYPREFHTDLTPIRRTPLLNTP